MIRILRVLEYEYPDITTMTKDMGRWYVGANATVVHPHMTLRSATMLPYEDEEIEEAINEAGGDNDFRGHTDIGYHTTNLSPDA